jgi:hypothetical protein
MKALEMKLPGRRPELPGNVISLYIVPLTPRIPLGRDGPRSGRDEEVG